LMTPEDYLRVREVFDRAMALPVAERRRFVDAHSPAGDPMRTELLAMVEAGDDSAFLATAVTAGVFDELPAPADTPAQIGKYKILRVLGRGGMGVVYLALRNDDAFRKIVALKVIGDSLDPGDAAHVERFKRERQILAALDHPNIARILDGGNTDEGRPFYVMEYVAGAPIDEYCRRMNTDVPTRVRMMAQACDAIEYLHNNAVAHRDVKPQNILVTLDGRVKLVDFGIARVEAAGALLNAVSSGGQPTLIMTPGYASPEQISGDVSGKSGDIYSIAVVLYQLLTGKLPYADAEGRPDLRAQLSGEAPEPPSHDLTKGVRRTAAQAEPLKVSYPDLDQVVLTALERDPLQRYATVQLFADDLRRCLDGRPIAVRSSSPIYTFRKFVGRNRLAAAAIALALVAASGATALAISARMERIALQAKESELERFIGLLDRKVQRWQEPEQRVSPAEKVADVQAANQVMASDSVRTLSERAPDPLRVKQLVNDLRRVLERADSISSDHRAVRKEIALALRQIGDFENHAPLAQIADKQGAAASYRRAARIVSEIGAAERPWANQQLSELSALLAGLGAPADPAAAVLSALPEAPAAAVEPPARAPATARAVSTASAQPPPAPAKGADVDPALRAELVQRLRSVTNDAQRARRSVEQLQASLASQGQALRPDIATALGNADGLIDDARAALDANDLTAADDLLRQAGSHLRKVFQAVGG